MKKKLMRVWRQNPLAQKILLTMRLTLFLIVLSVFTAYSSSYAQKAKLSLNAKNMQVKEVLNEIENQSEFFFMYDNKQVDVERLVSLEASSANIDQVLQKLFEGTSVNYKVVNRQILLFTESNLGTSTQQQKSVSGKVTDSTGSPLPGVSVVVKGTTNGTITDGDGKYSLPAVPENATLQFSFVGMKAQEVAVGGKATLNVKMEEETVGIEEVVAVGYGTQKKVNLTGSVISLRGEELTRRKVSNTSLALQGIAPGLTVTTKSGQPGKDQGTIRIRGIGTFGDSNPLVLVDGIESDINNVAPDDIENISVLKDAASSAIYGSRAANGVILITTKRAKENTFNINFKSFVGKQSPTNLPDIVNATDHMTMMNEAYTNVGRTPLYSDAYINEYKTQGSSNRDKYPDTDWQKLTYTGSGLIQNYYLGLEAGTERLKTLVSLNYLDQAGIVPNSGIRKYNIRFNNDLKITQKFSAAFDVYLSKNDMKESSVGEDYLFRSVKSIPATQAAIYSNGLYGEGWNGDNPLAWVDGARGLNENENYNATLNVDFKYQVASWLTANIKYSPKFYTKFQKNFNKSVQTYKQDFSLSFLNPQVNSLNESIFKGWYNNILATLFMNKSFDKAHNLSLLIGYQQEDSNDKWNTMHRESFPIDSYEVLNAGGTQNILASGSITEWSLQSYFGRFNYNYKEKYLFEANARYDGSSRFAPGKRFALFPSFSVGWRVSEEGFMSSLKDVITNMKIRASWGKLGNQNIGLYPYMSYIPIGQSNYPLGGKLYTGAAVLDMANKNIRWEETESSDLGLDFNILNKLSVTADYFYKKTSGILMRLDVPLSIGLTAPYQNAGVVENKGWEVATTYNDKIGKLNYYINAAISDVQNKILDMKGVSQTGLSANIEGYPVGALYGLEAIGFFQTKEEVASSPGQFGNLAPGDIKYKDQNDDKVINQKDYKIIGSTIPRYTYSLTIGADYKGFDFSLMLQGVGKANGYLFGSGIMPFYVGGTVQEQHKDRWTPTNTSATFPRFAFNETNNTQTSSFWMKNAAYLRVKNMQLGYTFPKSVINRIGVDRVRVYGSGENLLTFDKFWKGYDVEAPVGEGNFYPMVKTVTFGVELKF